MNDHPARQQASEGDCEFLLTREPAELLSIARPSNSDESGSIASDSLHRHLEACASCRAQWQVWQAALAGLSTCREDWSGGSAVGRSAPREQTPRPWESGERPLPVAEARAQWQSLGWPLATSDEVAECSCPKPCAIPVDGVVDPDQSARTVAGGNGKVQLAGRVARGESREGLGLPTSVLAVVAALTLIVVSFTWGRSEGWRSGWQARSPRIAAAGEWGRPSDAGLAQLSALAIPAACRGVADVLATDEALGGGADAARPGAAASVHELTALQFQCCTKCHRADFGGERSVMPELSGSARGADSPHETPASDRDAPRVMAVVASCTACHQLSDDVCGRGLPTKHWGANCQDCHELGPMRELRGHRGAGQMEGRSCQECHVAGLHEGIDRERRDEHGRIPSPRLSSLVCCL